MKRVIGFLLVAFCSSLASACTTFFINFSGQLVFGRNYDWLTGTGSVCTNQRNLAKTSFKTADGETISWVSLYGSITFNQYGKEFPTGGMNERGLVVELLWLDGSRYPEPDGRPAVGVLQWIQYQLDNCSNVEEVVATDKKLRIASTGTSPLHYLVADARGQAASIEFLDGKMIVHQGKDLPFAVLTNDNYAGSLRQTERPLSSTNEFYSFGNNSLERFRKTCRRIDELKQGKQPGSLVDYSFNILDEVAQQNTKWSIVYDISNRKISFKSTGYPLVKNISFSSFDFSCTVLPKTAELNQDQTIQLEKLMVPYSEEENKKITGQSFYESRTAFTISEEQLRQIWQYSSGIFCQK